MSRPKKKPTYDPGILMQQLLLEVTEAYLASAPKYTNSNGHNIFQQEGKVGYKGNGGVSIGRGT